MESTWNISQGYSKREHDRVINAFRPNSSIKKNHRSAFHYTSFETCIKMLKPFYEEGEEKPYLEFFASHFHYMNDTQEFFEGLSTISDILTNKISISNQNMCNTIQSFLKIYGKGTSVHHWALPPHYIVSFNNSGNNLAQWKYYGKNCGIAIEYDLPNCVFSNYSSDQEYTEHDSYYVIYNKNKQKEELIGILNELKLLEQSDKENNKEIHCKDILLKACTAASFMKNSHYKDEKEIRLLFAPYYPDAATKTAAESQVELMSKIEYRPRQNEYIIPYMKIRIKSSKHKYPIKSLTVGPGQNQDTIYKSLIMLAQTYFSNNSTKGLYPDNEITKNDCTGVVVNGIGIRKSLIPFRG